jgi:protein gp37
MSENTNIAWAKSTFNPWLGCTKVSPGCDGCYAEALMDKRMGRVKWGAGQPRTRTSEAYWRQPLAWEKKQRAMVEKWEAAVRAFGSEEAAAGLFFHKPDPWRVFCGSLCDVFDSEVPSGWRADLFELIERTPNLTWMLLTKRIGNALTMISDSLDDVMRSPRGWPWPNVWIGATVVNQEEADRDVPKLLRVPAAVRFLSIEPMLEQIDLRLASRNDTARWDACGRDLPLRRIDWVIVGGESDQPGHRARPFVCGWGKDIVRQCKAAGVPVFMKQLGGNATNREGDPHPSIARAGADPSEWPEDLRVREFPP